MKRLSLPRKILLALAILLVLYLIPCFYVSAELNRIVHDSYRTFGKQFRGGGGKHGGEFDYRIRARPHGVPRAGVFVQDGRLSPLNEIPAHYTEDEVGARSFPGGL